MDTRERVAKILDKTFGEEMKVEGWTWMDLCRSGADAILAIFAEERAAYWDDGEWNSSTARMKIKECAKQIVDLMHERDDWKTRAEKAEAREAALREALRDAREALRIYGHAMRCKYGKPGESAALPLGACTCGYFKNLMDIDAALAAAPIPGEVKITLIDPPAEGFSGGHDEPATPRDAAKEEKV